ncbi:MAG: hypothetical protein GY714_11300 [Desulfobacterales bacterium]|nr:hypothetical protein [Desulfobacterales bacterium]MCP4162476.1 hypothetical protein [Deltaproteobacteria bacterium]
MLKILIIIILFLLPFVLTAQSSQLENLKNNPIFKKFSKMTPEEQKKFIP